MAELITKQLIDITLLGVFQEEVDALVTGKETTLHTKIGTLPEGSDNVIAYIDSKVSEINGAAGTLEGRVEANETAIGKKAEGENVATGLYKYADDASKKAVDDIVNGATVNFDTLKEVEEWIKNDQSGAAKMQIDITTLKGSEADTSDSNSIVGAKKYADEKVGGKNVDAAGETGEDALVTATPANNKVTVASTAKLKAAVALAETSVQTVGKDTASSKETYVSLSVVDGDDATVALDDSNLAVKIGAASTTAPTGMYADIQGPTDLTVKDISDKVDALLIATEAQVRGLFA